MSNQTKPQRGKDKTRPDRRSAQERHGHTSSLRTCKVSPTPCLHADLSARTSVGRSVVCPSVCQSTVSAVCKAEEEAAMESETEQSEGKTLTVDAADRS